MRTETYEFWLIFQSPTGMRTPSTPRVSKKKPTLRMDEVAVKASISLPASLFVRPQVELKMTIPDTSEALNVTAEVQKGISDIIKEQLGVNVVLSAGE